MTWFPQVGLLLNDPAREGTWIKESGDYGVLKFGKFSADLPYPHMYVVFGVLSLREDIRTWVESQGWDYTFGRTPCITSPLCRGVIKFKEASHAVMFKLTWGGNE